MKRYILLFILLLLCFEIYSQDSKFCSSAYYGYFDKQLSQVLMDSLKKKGVNEFLLYQKSSNAQSEMDNKPNAFFIWREKSSAFVILVTDSIIYKERRISVNFFEYPFLNYLWLRKVEKPQFVAPVILPDYKKLVFYFSSNNSWFFEYGKNLFFHLDKKFDKYRKDYIQLLDNELSKLNGGWIFYKTYDRRREPL